jgi:glycosyltransferase involved in cell wall biosynthesis
MIPPLVSVLIPAYNSARYIGESLYSVSRSDYPNLETIVIDDGSTDHTHDVVAQFSGSLNYIKLEQNRGLAAALNAGIAAARGEFVARLDADDLSEPWRFHEQVKFLVENPDIAVVGCGADVFGAAYSVYRSPERHIDIVDAFLVGNPIIHPTVMVRRDLIRENAYFYDETALNEEDYELWARLIAQGKMLANQPYSGIKYRLHDSNNQLHPSKRAIKKKALMVFCRHFGVDKEIDIDTLLDFQCSGFITKESFHSLRDYARRAVENGWPKLGWLQENLLSSQSYKDFSVWYWKMKGVNTIV